MAITKVQSVTGNGSGLTLNGVASANALTVTTTYFRASGTTAPGTPTDTNGTFTVASADVPVSGPAGVTGTGIWVEANTASGTHTIGGLETNHHSVLCEWSGLTTSTPFDVAKSASTSNFSGTSQVTGTTAATAQASELSLIALSLAAASGSANVGLTDPVTGYTTLQIVQNDSTDIATMQSFKVLSATGTQSATFNWTDNEANQQAFACIATFKASGATFNPGWAYGATKIVGGAF